MTGKRPKIQGGGLAWKLHWRPVLSEVDFHCFQRIGTVYESLCGRHELELIGGGATARPPAMLRCARCDIKEMDIRGHDESMDETPEWMRFRDAWIAARKR